MKKKGELNQVGGLVIFAVAVIVCLALIPQIATNQEQMQHVYTYNSSTGSGIITPAVAGSDTWITGQDLLSTPIVRNQTGTEACAVNVTFSEGVNPTTGVKGIKMTSVATYNSAVACRKVNVSYNYGAEGYISDSGARTISQQILLFTALALLAISIFYWAKNSGWINI